MELHLPSIFNQDYGWSFTRISPNVYFMNDTTLSRFDTNESINAFGSSRHGFRRGLHFFDFAFDPTQSVRIGVCSEDFDYFDIEKNSKISENEITKNNECRSFSMFWDSTQKIVYANNETSTYPAEENLKKFSEFSGSTVLPGNFKISLDMNLGTCKFFACGIDLGVAFTNLNLHNKKIYIVVSIPIKTSVFMRLIETDEITSFDRTNKLYNPNYEKIRNMQIDQPYLSQQQLYKISTDGDFSGEDADIEDCCYDDLDSDGTDPYITDDDFNSSDDV